VGINGGIVNLIPTLKSWVNQYYPGLQTAITEYTWGDEANLNGATTQADVLGIFGREGLDIATYWTVPANPSPTYLAMEIYRNYDGKLSTFGDTSVSAAVANPDYLEPVLHGRGRLLVGSGRFCAAKINRRFCLTRRNCASIIESAHLDFRH
jgi:hypothetical protein